MQLGERQVRNLKARDSIPYAPLFFMVEMANRRYYRIIQIAKDTLEIKKGMYLPGSWDGFILSSVTQAVHLIVSAFLSMQLAAICGLRTWRSSNY